MAIIWTTIGAAIYFIRDAWNSFLALIFEIMRTGAEFSALVDRIMAPEFPIADPLDSFWQTNPTLPELIDLKSEVFPNTADIVIIGSGISGVSIAYTLLSECRLLGLTKKVVVLEARNTCSGATGRNGGHLKFSAYTAYADLKSRFDLQSAKKIMNFQQKHLPIILNVVETERLTKTDAREVETVDMFIDSDMWEKAKKMVQELEEDLPEFARDIRTWESEEARKKFGFSRHCHGAISYSAGAIWPYRFVTALYASLLSEYQSSFTIETGTLVTEIHTDGGDTGPYRLCTSRGDLSARHIVHATDAFAPKLIPGLKGKIFPIRGHMTAQQPRFPSDLDGSRSWSIVGKKGFEYVTQRPRTPSGDASPGGEIMLGGGLFQSEGKGLDEIGIWHDNRTSATISAYLTGIWSTVFQNDDHVNPNSTQLLKVWTGCMGYTVDLLPYVGKLDYNISGRRIDLSGYKAERQAVGMTLPSEWISAGFSGDGMVAAWLSGTAVGLMILGRENISFQGRCGRPDGKVKDWFPQELRCSITRINRSSIYDLAHMV